MELAPAAIAALVGLVVCGYAVEAVAGFGSVVLVVTLGAQVLPLERLVPALVPLNQVLSAYLTLRYARHIDRRVLWRGILPWMAIGTAVGLVLFYVVTGDMLKRAFGLVVVAFSGAELVTRLRGTAAAPESRGAVRPWILLAGVTHGLYASGGPLLVYAVGRMRLDKHAFRATLSAVWLILGFVLIATYVAQGSLRGSDLRLSGWLAAGVVPGIVVGEWLHRRVDERRFQLLVYTLLVLAGAILVVR